MTNRRFILILLTSFFGLTLLSAQNYTIDSAKIKLDLEQLINNLTNYYVYLDEKMVDLDCIRDHYFHQVSTLKTEEEVVLLFEMLLDEFYDGHVMLNTNRNASFRLYAPIYTVTRNGQTIINNVWMSQIDSLKLPICGAVVEKINGQPFQEVIDEFPTHCHNKQSDEIRTWLGNKVLAGRYNTPRMLTLSLKDGRSVELDLDQVKTKHHNTILETRKLGKVGLIRLNNSLGNNALIAEFDRALDSLFDTKGMIIDLRNTVDGGNTYVARGIMGRFMLKDQPYQKHVTFERYGENPSVKRSWIEYVSPRLSIYKKPLVVLVGRWTGSMGEGLAIGMDGSKRGKIVGTEMERLAGGMYGFNFKHQNYGYRLSLEKLLHIDGTPREKFVPEVYVKQTTLNEDQILSEGLRQLEVMIKESYGN